MSEEILAEIHVSQPRRWMGVAIMALLGGLLVYITLVMPPENILWQAFLLVLGLAALWLAEATRKATELSLRLSEERLIDSSGEEIARVEDIASVSRGMFAFKPSNGFVLVLKSKASRRWRPGVWWRLGRRVGIGGVTPGPQGKAAAQIIEALIAGRNPQAD